jgi:hypothetical protein
MLSVNAKTHAMFFAQNMEKLSEKGIFELTFGKSRIII